MDDLFKKFINTGVGFLSQGNKRVQTALDKLVKESKISEQEGKKIMDDLLKSGEAKRKDLEKQLQDLTENLRDRVGLSTDAAPKTAAPKAASVAKKAAGSPVSKAASPTKKAAGKVSGDAAKTQRPAAGKTSAAKKPTKID